MADDYYTQVAQHRLNQIDAEKAAHLATLTQFRADGDMDGGAHAAQQIANLEAERQNIISLHQQHMAAVNPAPPVPETESEWKAKSAEKMTPVDALQVFGKSKYFPKDPAGMSLKYPGACPFPACCTCRAAGLIALPLGTLMLPIALIAS